MDEAEALASERKALTREIVRMERETASLREKLKVTRGGWQLAEKLRQAEGALLATKAKLAKFDRDLMDE